MNWLAVSAIAEVLGVVVIIISLVYVAVQIKQNTKQLSLALKDSHLRAFEHNIESSIRARQVLISNPEIMHLVVKGSTEYSSLSLEEKIRFGLWVRNSLSELHGVFIRECLTDHSPGGRLGYVKALDELLESPGVFGWVDRHMEKFDWRPEFHQLVVERLASRKSQTENENSSI